MLNLKTNSIYKLSKKSGLTMKVKTTTKYQVQLRQTLRNINRQAIKVISNELKR